MRFGTSDEFLTVIGAYQRAWMSLLSEEYVTVGNLERTPVLLMTAILESAASGNLDENELTEAGLKRFAQIELEIDSVTLN
jgi:hypothetical protein